VGEKSDRQHTMRTTSTHTVRSHAVLGGSWGTHHIREIRERSQDFHGTNHTMGPPNKPALARKLGRYLLALLLLQAVPAPRHFVPA